MAARRHFNQRHPGRLRVHPRHGAIYVSAAGGIDDGSCIGPIGTGTGNPCKTIARAVQGGALACRILVANGSTTSRSAW
jgi:hypothetical protein